MNRYEINMNNTDYQRIRAISSHWLISCLTSPAECWRKYLDPNRPLPESTAALRLGTLVHGLAFTPHLFEREFIVHDYERRSHAGKQTYATLMATGKTVIRPREREQAQAVVAALKAHPEARKLLLYGKKERTLLQPRQPSLLPLKARLDVHDEARRQVVELKTIRDLNLVESAMKRYHYPLSAAFYQHLVRGQSVIMVFVQTTPPHEVAVMPMDRTTLTEGQEQYRFALERFDACWCSGVWPEAEPAPTQDFDEDPLWMPVAPVVAGTSHRPHTPLGELTL